NRSPRAAGGDRSLLTSTDNSSRQCPSDRSGHSSPSPPERGSPTNLQNLTSQPSQVIPSRYIRLPNRHPRVQVAPRDRRPDLDDVHPNPIPHRHAHNIRQRRSEEHTS